jgi:hypothetical protein
MQIPLALMPKRRSGPNVAGPLPLVAETAPLHPSSKRKRDDARTASAPR